MEYEKLFYKIQNRAESNNLAFFIGAGISRISDYPSWSDLVKSMADDINYIYETNNKGEALFSSEELLKIPQMYSVNNGETEYVHKAKTHFSIERKANIIHNLILALNPKHILTTNYDTLIEQAALKAGKNFNIISSDKNVSQVDSTNYLIKVHGDFSGKFVLKEEDYLDYEENFRLIDNVVKTVFATNLVIFIGYGLNDYNIKLILNWVKRVQGDTFIKPVFIHTGNTLSEIEINYYDSRGLEILDCNSFTQTDDYTEKYATILTKIINYNSTSNLKSNTKILEHIFSKLNSIEELSYIRRKDFKIVFDNEYELDDQRNIANPKKEVEYFETLFGHIADFEKLEPQKTNYVLNFCKRYEINWESNKKYAIQITEEAFFNNYSYMEDYCEHVYTSIHDNYKKAYYLFLTGDMESSYQVYTELLLQTKNQNDWIHYYFCQINRNYVYRAIKQYKQHSEGVFGVLNFGTALKLFDDGFINQLESDMSEINMHNLWNQLPYESRKNLSMLKQFSDSNCYMEESIELLEEKYEVEKALSKFTLNFGISKFDKVKFNMLDTVKFIYENMLLFPIFSGHKKYVKNALMSWLQGYSNDINSNIEDPFKQQFSNSRYDFTFEDILLIVKCFKKEDVDYLSNIVDLKSLPFSENEKLENYLMTQINYMNDLCNESITSSKTFLFKNMSDELKNLLVISHYYIKDVATIEKIIKFIIQYPPRELDMDNKVEYVKYWLCTVEITKSILTIIELWLMEQLGKADEGSTKYKDRARININALTDLFLFISHKKPEYTSTKLSNYVLSNKETDTIKFYTNSLLICLNIFREDAKKVIIANYRIDDIQCLIFAYKRKIINNINEHSNIITTYLDECKTKKEQTVDKTFIIFPTNEDKINIVMGTLAKVILLEKTNYSVATEKYHGLCSEFDFLLNINYFNEEEFQIQWVLNYTDDILSLLSQNDKQRNLILGKIKKYYDGNQMNKSQMKRLFKVYTKIALQEE